MKKIKKKILAIINFFLNNNKDDKFNYINEVSFGLSESNLNYLNKIPFQTLNNRINHLQFKQKIIDLIYIHYKKILNIEISQKAFNLILSPFVYTFVDVIDYKIERILKAKKNNKKILFYKTREIFYEYPENYSELLSMLQSDKFNLQIDSEILNFFKFKSYYFSSSINLKKIIKNIFVKKFDNKNIKQEKLIKKLKKINKIYYYKLDFRNKYAIDKIFKHKKLKKLNLSRLNISFIKKNLNLRRKMLMMFNSKNKKEKIIFQLLLKYIPSLYLESIIQNLNKFISSNFLMPSYLISNPFGWWNDDFFRYFLATYIDQGGEYIDVQHNGSYFIFDNNEHFEISKCFRKYFFGWGDYCLKYNDTFYLPPLYTIRKKRKKIFKGRKILMICANVNRYFQGYRNSILDGGNHLSYFNNQVKFITYLKNKVVRDLYIRARYNRKDPNNYKKFLKEKFNQIKFDNIKNNTASDRINQNDVKIIIVDHLSTPWLEALNSNKPTIIFYNKENDKFSRDFKKILLNYKNNKIFFDSPVKAANWLNIIYKNNIIRKKWWNSKETQDFRKVLLKNFYKSQINSINIWSKKLLEII